MDWPIAQEAIKSELGNDEDLLWNAQPRQGIVFRSYDIFMIPFSLMWGGFAIFWEITALSIPKGNAGPVGIIFPLFGLPFVVVGLYLIFGRFIVDSQQRKKTFYGLTKQRIIIISGVFSHKVESLDLKTLTNISMDEKSDGSGTINFGQKLPFWWFAGMSWPGMPKPGPLLEMVDNAKDVYEKIRKAQASY